MSKLCFRSPYVPVAMEGTGRPTPVRGIGLLVPASSGSFAAADIGIKTFEDNTWSSTPTFDNGSGGSPGYNSGTGRGHRILNTAGEAFAGSYFMQTDYTAPGPEYSMDCQILRGQLGASPYKDLIYWKYRTKFEGTPISSVMKYFRIRDASGAHDIGGLYLVGGGGTTQLGWNFGGDDGNFNHAIGVGWGAQPAGLSSRGWTDYGSNWLNDGVYHTIVVNAERNPNHATAINPRVRFLD